MRIATRCADDATECKGETSSAADVHAGQWSTLGINTDGAVRLTNLRANKWETSEGVEGECYDRRQQGIRRDGAPNKSRSSQQV